VMTISTVTVTPAEISAAMTALEPAYNTTTFAPTFTRS
jgi:hypothetical protein